MNGLEVSPVLAKTGSFPTHVEIEPVDNAGVGLLAQIAYVLLPAVIVDHFGKSSTAAVLGEV